MNCAFEKGQSFYLNGDFKESFEIFNSILNDKNSTFQEKSNALNMLGVILVSDPSLSIENEFEESLDYFRKAIELDSTNLGALLNIVESFGSSFGQHKDLKLFKKAYDKLIELSNSISDSDKMMINNKYQLYLLLS